MPTQWLSLGNDRRIAVSSAHRFGTDAVLLAHFAKPQADELVCDLGTGCGIIPFLWLRDEVYADMVGVELQKEAVALTKISLSLWGNPKNISFIHADLREWACTQDKGFDRVVCNPPYFPVGSGRVAVSPVARLARHEGEGCTFDEICAAVTHLLKPDGRFCFCHRPTQRPRLEATLTSHRFSITKLITVSQRVNTAPFLLLAEAQQTDIAGSFLEQSWVLEENGAPTPITRCIYAPFHKEGHT